MRAPIATTLVLCLGFTAAASEPKVAEWIFRSGLAPGWNDYGWAPRKIEPGGPARLNFSNHGGWIIAKPTLKGSFGALVFRYRTPADYGDFLEVTVDFGYAASFPHVAVDAQHRVDLPDGWREVTVPMEQLNPEHQQFDRIMLRARGSVRSDEVELDQIGLAPASAAPPPPKAVVTKVAAMTVDCAATSRPISPLIYGIAFQPGDAIKETHQWQLGATARRWGGNPSSRYNWRLGNAWNTANDWFFQNVNYTGMANFSYEKFLELNLSRHVATALTVPTLGWVAKDTKSYAFPASVFGPQQATAPENGEAGNGMDKRGKPISPGVPTTTSIASTPASIGEWVSAIREKDKRRGRSVQMYILDNEPMLWNSTHRDVHPAPVTYDELLDRTIAYGTAVRRADPEAVIAGPALWGWPAYFFSALDAEKGFWRAPDRRAHGDIPLLAWWLRKVKEHEQKTGVHLIDVVDVHFYPMAQNMGPGTKGGTDPETAARRIRSTRALWDPTYVDESWIHEAVRLIPRLREWISANHPGLGISIGEYNFGAERHMSGGLALAEALGRFGSEGVTSAFYWDYPAKDSPAFWAFRAYRNFDGKGGRFLENSLQSRTDSQMTSLFASRDTQGEEVVAVALNFDPSTAADANIHLHSCGEVKEERVFTYQGESVGFAQSAPEAAIGDSLHQKLPPYSITVFDLRFRPVKRVAKPK